MEHVSVMNVKPLDKRRDNLECVYSVHCERSCVDGGSFVELQWASVCAGYASLNALSDVAIDQGLERSTRRRLEEVEWDMVCD